MNRLQLKIAPQQPYVTSFWPALRDQSGRLAPWWLHKRRLVPVVSEICMFGDDHLKPWNVFFNEILEQSE